MNYSNADTTTAIPALSLYELNTLVSSVLSLDLPDDYWVEAELSEAREVRGHCYMELVQKDEASNTPIAKASAKCWASRWSILRPMFERVTGQRLHAGMKVMLRVKAQFHAAYGFSWIVSDINPEYTMGDLMRRRQEIIKQLKAEGVFDLQRELTIPAFAQHIAVVSSDGAAGYGDFCRQLADNAQGYRFTVRLFSATMQGEAVEQSVIAALNRIYEEQDVFDAVVIIRGGGATSDLSGFDTLALAENVANFPLPIITGIGHERDESVLDMISFRKVKTPTAAAAFLVQHLTDVYVRVMEAQETIVQNVKHRLQVEKMRLDRLNKSIPVQFSLVKTRQGAYIDRLMNRLSQQVLSKVADAQRKLEILSQNVQPVLERKMMSESHRLQMLEQRIRSQDPELLLKRGYSITLKNGKSIRSASLLTSGDVIITRFAEGTVKSKVE